MLIENGKGQSVCLLSHWFKPVEAVGSRRRRREVEMARSIGSTRDEMSESTLKMIIMMQHVEGKVIQSSLSR